MINEIVLRDFQSHKLTRMELHPGFNIICGPSGNGKSSIIRAINYLAFNHLGTSEVRLPDAKSYHIEVVVNGQRIQRDKGVGINSYTINKNEPLIDVNKDVPKSVTDVLNIKKIALDSSCDADVQFSSQLDGPFMLNEKDSVKMKFLNILSGTNAVDLAAKRANAICKENLKIAKNAKEELEKLKEEEKELKLTLNTVSERVNFLKKSAKTLKDLESLRTPLILAQQMSDRVHADYKKVKFIEKTLLALDLDALNIRIDKMINLLSLSEKYKSLKSKYFSLKNSISALNTVVPADITQKIDRLMNLISLRTTRDMFKTKYLAFKQQEEKIQTELSNNKNTYIVVLKEQRSCPICGGSITTECIDKIINSL